MSDLQIHATPAAGSVTLADRRAYVRHPCHLGTSCHPVTSGQGQEWVGQAINISQGGVGLVLNRRFEKGTLLSVEVTGVNGQPGRTLFARVAHICQQSDGSWMIGCAFANKLTVDEVNAIL
jgi:hypothetical protein